MKKGRGRAGLARRGQTGYSQPIPKAGIGGSPRFAAYRPTGPKTVKHRDGVVTQNFEVMCVSRVQISPFGTLSCRGGWKFCDAKPPIPWTSPGWAMRDLDVVCMSPIRG